MDGIPGKGVNIGDNAKKSQKQKGNAGKYREIGL